MTRRFLLTILLFSLSCADIPAQLNESDSIRFQWRSSITGNYQQGNVNVLTIRSRAEFSFRPGEKFVFKSQNSSLYQEFSRVKADNDVFSRNYIYYSPERKVYPFGMLYVAANYRRKINNRIFYGAGATWQVLSKKWQVIKLSASVVYEQNRFRGTSYSDAVYNGSNRINTWRGTLYAAGWHYLAGKRIRLYYDAYWQPAFGNQRNYRTQADLGIDIPVWKGVYFTTLFSYTHENVVVTGIKKDDRILTFGAGYNFRSAAKNFSRKKNK
ncbi:MAG: DUF481 domain-containing protein [Bacteroidetes bacterium]|nr:DUF481 domain-containing protein [Bacteroidota bacterium]